MKNIELSTALDLKTFLPDFYEDLSYDGSPKLEEYIPSGIWFSLYEGETIAGFINLEPINNVMWNTHIFIYETFRGNNSEEWGKQTAQFMKHNVEARKFLAFTPYKIAKKYAEKVGFKYVTTLTNSIKKNGEVLDQYMLEMSI